MKKINISDITLKKLSENRSVSLLFREKSAIASCADRLGTDCIELPAVKSIREDSIIYKTIAKNIRSAALAIPVGFTSEELSSAWECIKDAKSPRLQIELPVSTIQMEYTYHVKQQKMLERIGELVCAAKELCADVEFSALDATRADEDFLIAASREAEAKGAGIITLCDCAGNSTPDQIAAMVAKVKAAVSVPVYVQLSDRIYMAVASAFAAIGAGADGLKCAMVGNDVLRTGEISDAVNTCGAQIGAEIKLGSTSIHARIEDMMASINHEAYETESTVSDKKKILLDSDSTLAQVASAAALLGYELSDSDVGNVYKALAQVCEKKGAVGAKEFEALIASSAMQAPSTYHFENYTTTSSNLSSSMTQITLKCDGEIICGVSAGDGPIDSAFRAIEQCIGHHYELDDYQVQSVTEGKEALGSALVRLREGGKLYSGNGTSTDIVAASIRAYINALNKIVFEEA
jgi:2-isopropylmalate synthase